MPGPRGVPQVPLEPGMSPQLRRFLVDMRENLVNLQHSQAPINAPSNLVVTPQDRGNLLQFTRPANADFFEVLWNTSADITTAQTLNLTTSNQYFDWIGKDGVTRFYWVRARRIASNVRSLEAGPVSGTSKPAGQVVPPPTPPPIGQVQREIIIGGGSHRIEFE